MPPPMMMMIGVGDAMNFAGAVPNTITARVAAA
jgi:hypothetical protein